MEWKVCQGVKEKWMMVDTLWVISVYMWRSIPKIRHFLGCVDGDGRQGRRPVPLARGRRAPAPRAGGGRAAFRFGWCGGRSRRRQAHEQGPAVCKGMRWATLPCPAGTRGAASVRGRRCLPLRGKSAAELARLILVCRGRELFAERFALQEWSDGAPGRKNAAAYAP